MQRSGRKSAPSFSLCFQKRNVFVNGGSAQIAHTGKFADIQMPGLIGRIVAEEDCGNIVFCYLRAAYLLALGLCVRHSGTHPLDFQFYNKDNLHLDNNVH